MGTQRVGIGLVVGLSAVLTSTVGCGGGDGGSGLRTMGMLGTPSVALVGANVFLIDAALNGHPGGRLLVDTGSPFTLVDPSQFPGAVLQMSTQVSVDIGVGAVTIDAVPALQFTSGTMDDLHLGGILGGNVMRQFSTEFNYRDKEFRIGAGTAPADVAQPGTAAAFKIEGGGMVSDGSMSVTFPATRISITVSVEGVDHPFILDTGASEVTVRTSLFSALTGDGRTIMHGFPVGTASGLRSANVSRLRSVSLAGEELLNPLMLTLSDDELLDQLAAEVTHPVDGLLGGNFLREFLVTIDYPHGTVHLRRYATRAHILDEFQRVGITLSPNAGYQVGTVFAGSDAQRKGVTVGDRVTAIDGQTLTSLSALAVDPLLEGAVGTSHQVTFGVASSPALAFQTVDLLVDDLVPPP